MVSTAMLKIKVFIGHNRSRKRGSSLVHNLQVSLISNPLAASPLAPASDVYLSQCVQLVAQYAQGSCALGAGTRASAEHAFGLLYDHTAVRVHAMVRRFVHDDAAAQEVTEDVFFSAWMHAGRFDAQRGSVLAWLLTMARSKALDAWRQHAARLVHFDSDMTDDLLVQASVEATPLDLLAAADKHHALHAALAQVPAGARQMLSLAFFQGLTHSEISEHLSAPLGTVKTTLRRALLSLRASLHDSCGPGMTGDLLVEE